MNAMSHGTLITGKVYGKGGFVRVRLIRGIF